MTSHKEKHAAPAVASMRIGGGEWVPVCDDALEAGRKLSAKAGKKALPKAATKAQAAAIVGRNGDDALPIEVRALTEVERLSGVTCFAHRIKELAS